MRKLGFQASRPRAGEAEFDYRLGHLKNLPSINVGRKYFNGVNWPERDADFSSSIKRHSPIKLRGVVLN